MAIDAGGAAASAVGRFAPIELLADVLADREVLKAGADGTAVQVLQETLRDMGFPMMVLRAEVGVSGVDGSFGGQTETALRNFQVHAWARRSESDPVRRSGSDPPEGPSFYVDLTRRQCI